MAVLALLSHVLFFLLPFLLPLPALSLARVLVSACDATVYGPRRADRQDASANQLQ